MKNILVSGSSGIVGYGILRSLRKIESDLKLIGTTVYVDSVAQAFCDVFEQAPLTNSHGYIDWLVKIIDKYQIDLLIPGIEADMYKWADNIEQIEKTGAKALINNFELLALCKDKWEFYSYLSTKDSIHSIPSSLSADYKTLVDSFGLPFLLKPRCGFGSKGIVVVSNEDVFDLHKDAIGGSLMAQLIVGNDDEEYSTSAFCDGKGGFQAFMTLKRKLSHEGFTEKAEVVPLLEMEDILSSLCEIFKPIGPTNFQFRRHDGVLKLLEINPRVSSSTSIRTAFGYNEMQMTIQYFLENKPIVQPTILSGKAVRYIEDYVFFDNI